MTLAMWLLYVVGAPMRFFTAGAFGAGFLGFVGLARFGSDIFSALSLGCLILTHSLPRVIAFGCYTKSILPHPRFTGIRIAPVLPELMVNQLHVCLTAAMQSTVVAI